MKIHRKICSAADAYPPPAAGVLNSPASKQALSAMVVITVAILPLLMEIRGAPLTLRRVGDWLGWLGAGMLSSSLLLMVREPFIVRWFGGLARMYRWHHEFGVWACVVLLAHPLVLAAAVIPTSATRAWNLLSPARWFPSNALGWSSPSRRLATAQPGSRASSEASQLACKDPLGNFLQTLPDLHRCGSLEASE